MAYDINLKKHDSNHWFNKLHEKFSFGKDSINQRNEQLAVVSAKPLSSRRRYKEIHERWDKGRGKWKKKIVTDSYSEESYDERIDVELGKLIKEYSTALKYTKKNIIERLKTVVNLFIEQVELALADIRVAQENEENREKQRIDHIIALINRGITTNSTEIKKEIKNLLKKLSSDNERDCVRELHRHRRLGKAKAPMGYILRKQKDEVSLDRDIERLNKNEQEDVYSENILTNDLSEIIEKFNANPSKEDLERIKTLIHSIVVRYRKDLKLFVVAEVDLDIETARKLHRINHYVNFLSKIDNDLKKSGFQYITLTDEIKKLQQLQKSASEWVYQDTLSMKKLIEYSKRVDYDLQVLKDSEANMFAGLAPLENKSIGREGFKVQIFKKHITGRINRGIVVMHGITTNKETMQILCKRLALQEFVVVNVDMSGHGENTSEFRVGRNAEYIQDSVQYLRQEEGLEHVGVVAHSAGAVSSLFALCGYNVKIEEEFYDLVNRILEATCRIDDLSKNNKSTVEERIKAIRASTKLKELILTSVTDITKGNKRIDALALLGMPKEFQMAYSDRAIKWGRLMAKLRLRKITNRVMKHATDWYNEKMQQDREGSEVFKFRATDTQTQVRDLIVDDYVKFMEYIQNIKTPFDYIDYVKSLCETESTSKFMQYYRDNFIKKPPKLFLYGLKDLVLFNIPTMITRRIKSTQIIDIDNYYKFFTFRTKDKGVPGDEIEGSSRIVRYPNLIHSMTLESLPDFEFYNAAHPKPGKAIIQFMNSHLPKGSLKTV